MADHPLAGRLALTSQPPLEAQIAAIADDVAYSNHDLDDGLRAGFIALDELAEVPLAERRWPRSTGCIPDWRPPGASTRRSGG